MIPKDEILPDIYDRNDFLRNETFEYLLLAEIFNTYCCFNELGYININMSERQVGGTLGQKGEKFMKKAEREKCWGAKDKFWDCLRNNKEDEKCVIKCANLRKDYLEACPATWVTHFDRKFHYENYKTKLYKDGVDVHDKNFAAQDAQTVKMPKKQEQTQ